MCVSFFQMYFMLYTFQMLLFNEFDFLDRFDEAKKIGFKAIEFQFPYSYDANQIKRKLLLQPHS